MEHEAASDSPLDFGLFKWKRSELLLSDGDRRSGRLRGLLRDFLAYDPGPDGLALGVLNLLAVEELAFAVGIGEAHGVLAGLGLDREDAHGEGIQDIGDGLVGLRHTIE